MVHAKLPATRYKARIGPSHLRSLSTFLFPRLFVSLDSSPFGTTPGASLKSSDHVIWKFHGPHHCLICVRPHQPSPSITHIAQSPLPPRDKRGLVQTRASLSTTPTRKGARSITGIQMQRGYGSYVITHVVSQLVLPTALTLAAASSNSRSPLVAVDTRVEDRTGEQKTIGPLHACPRSTVALFASVTWPLWGLFGP